MVWASKKILTPIGFYGIFVKKIGYLGRF